MSFILSCIDKVVPKFHNFYASISVLKILYSIQKKQNLWFSFLKTLIINSIKVVNTGLDGDGDMNTFRADHQLGPGHVTQQVAGCFLHQGQPTGKQN